MLIPEEGIRLGELFKEWFERKPPKGYCCYIMYSLMNKKDSGYFKDNGKHMIEYDYWEMNGKYHHVLKELKRCLFCGREYDE